MGAPEKNWKSKTVCLKWLSRVGWGGKFPIKNERVMVKSGQIQTHDWVMRKLTGSGRKERMGGKVKMGAGFAPQPL